MGIQREEPEKFEFCGCLWFFGGNFVVFGGSLVGI